MRLSSSASALPPRRVPIVQLASTEHATALERLRLFAYGTYADYRADPSKFGGELSDAQLTKLKMLSVVTMAQSTKTISYDSLLSSLELPGVRELEDLVIQCFYGGILSGKLDQRGRLLEVSSVMGRDVRPGQVDEMIAALKGWKDTCRAVELSIDDKVSVATAAKLAEETERDDLVARVTATREAVRNSPEMRGAGGSGDGFYDDGESAPRRGRGKRRPAPEMARHRA